MPSIIARLVTGLGAAGLLLAAASGCAGTSPNEGTAGPTRVAVVRVESVGDTDIATLDALVRYDPRRLAYVRVETDHDHLLIAVNDEVSEGLVRLAAITPVPVQGAVLQLVFSARDPSVVPVIASMEARSRDLEVVSSSGVMAHVEVQPADAVTGTAYVVRRVLEVLDGMVVRASPSEVHGGTP